MDRFRDGPIRETFRTSETGLISGWRIGIAWNIYAQLKLGLSAVEVLGKLETPGSPEA